MNIFDKINMLISSLKIFVHDVMNLLYFEKFVNKIISIILQQLGMEDTGR